MDCKGKNIIITGGAGTIGYEIAKVYLDRGVNVSHPFPPISLKIYIQK